MGEPAYATEKALKHRTPDYQFLHPSSDESTHERVMVLDFLKFFIPGIFRRSRIAIPACCPEDKGWDPWNQLDGTRNR
jgi:hypothetical protein